MIESITGVVAIIFMLGAYICLNWVKYSNLFLVFNAISCVSLLIYSIIVMDWVFICVNLIAGTSLAIRYFRGGIAHICTEKYCDRRKT